VLYIVYNAILYYTSLSFPISFQIPMTSKDDLSEYQPPNPPRSNIVDLVERHEEEVARLGLPLHTGIFRWAKDIGRVRLAREIVSLDLSMETWSGSPFSDRAAAIYRVTNMLASISDAAIILLVENRLHEAFFKPADPQLHLPFQHHAAQPMSHELPVIYTLVHCGPAGQRPTKAEYTRVVDLIEVYSGEFESRNDPGWVDADRIAKEIDYIDPKISGRGWTSGNQGSRLRSWTKSKSGANIAHPRRYCSSPKSRVVADEWIQQTRKRFESIPAEMDNKMLPWSFGYVGWSRQESRRSGEHYNHTGTTNSLA
jgi:hypothetical protein